MQMGFYFDQSRCVGCYVCVAACRSWNQLDQEMPNPVEIRTREQGEFPILSVTHLFLTCFHCAEPGLFYATAISRRKTMDLYESGNTGAIES